MRRTARARMTALVLALALSASLPALALAGSPRVYHGTWDTAGWTFDPTTCPFPAEGPASGNWNVTILPHGTTAVVHVTIFTMGMHIASWGGQAPGDVWTVDQVTADGFALHEDVSATSSTSASTFTFVLEGGRLTFSIAPWVLLNPDGITRFACDAAVSSGPLR